MVKEKMKKFYEPEIYVCINCGKTFIKKHVDYTEFDVCSEKCQEEYYNYKAFCKFFEKISKSVNNYEYKKLLKHVKDTLWDDWCRFVELDYIDNKE